MAAFTLQSKTFHVLIDKLLVSRSFLVVIRLSWLAARPGCLAFFLPDELGSACCLASF